MNVGISTLRPHLSFFGEGCGMLASQRPPITASNSSRQAATIRQPLPALLVVSTSVVKHVAISCVTRWPALDQQQQPTASTSARGTIVAKAQTGRRQSENGPEDDWDAALMSEFPAGKFKDEDMPGNEDVLDPEFDEETGSIDPAALLQKSDSDEEGPSDEDEGEDDDEDEDEEDDGGDIIWDQVATALEVEVENVDYDTISRERNVRQGARAEVVEITEQEQEREAKEKRASDVLKATALALAGALASKLASKFDA